ncbi:MAG: hypothetical protein JW395_1623 [Nitrospira sp.]|nr:hypothetical protein [Nitrospira sp.]
MEDVCHISIAVDQRGALTHSLLRIYYCLKWLVFNVNKLKKVFGVVSVWRHNQSDRLADVADLVCCQDGLQEWLGRWFSVDTGY